MAALILMLSSLLATSSATTLYDRNLAYRSPYAEHPQLSVDTKVLASRHVHEFSKRQNTENSFNDEHYPTFYGSTLENSPFVWSGGINFTHSVASGDPFDTSVLIWTRAFPLGAEPDQSVPVCVSYSFFASPTAQGRPIKTEEGFTSWDVDFTIKFEVTGLKPDTQYFYRFADCTNPSTVTSIGKTRTLPSPNTPAKLVNGGKPLTLGIFSCSQFQTGWFNAYGIAAHNTSAEIFVHLGDYIYESVGNGASIGRAVMGRELATIHDYRQRYAQYRTDPNLIAAHLNAPWINVWVFANNAWKAGTGDSNDTTAGCAFSPSGACFTDRKMAAVRAYHEWLPIRQVVSTDLLRIWRNFQIGKLLDLTMLDTRQYDRDVTDVTYNHVIATLASAPSRSLMGSAQEKWFSDTLIESQRRGAVWRLVGQQIVFTQLMLDGVTPNLDGWDGYRANRERILTNLQKHKISNAIILSGDSHANWVSDLAHPNGTTTYNPLTGAGSLAVEFAGTAVSSPSVLGAGITPEQADPVSTLLVAQNPDLQWSEASFRGFFTLTIDAKRVNATYYAMRDLSNPNLSGFVSATFTVNAGENRIQRPVAGGSVAAGVLKSPAPPTPPSSFYILLSTHPKRECWSGNIACADLIANRDQYPRTAILLKAVVEALVRDDFAHRYLERGVVSVFARIYQARSAISDEYLPKTPFSIDNVKASIRRALKGVKVVENLTTIEDPSGNTKRLWSCVLKDTQDAELLGGEVKDICLNADMVAAYEQSPCVRVQEISGALIAGTFVYETMHVAHLSMFQTTPTFSIGWPRDDPSESEESGFVLEESLFGGAMGTIWDATDNKSGQELFKGITNFTISTSLQLRRPISCNP
ncbi:Alkaline phosphatase D [Mycena kentingensis (nom. inval.)]|nr:Alkaline phosphatase D [Mycena kentingensis (nom. inval.)]